ncbi:hypothetical protein E2320_001466 [Naja naja]|nr:hypothetical protein E2320_001466 [Naja naja]
MQRSLLFCPIKVRSPKKRSWPSLLTDFRACRLGLTWPDELQGRMEWWTKRQRELALKVHAGCVVTPYELILDHLVGREVNHCKRPRLSASPPGESPEVVEKDNRRRRPLWRLAYSAGHWVNWRSSISEAQGFLPWWLSFFQETDLQLSLLGFQAIPLEEAGLAVTWLHIQEKRRGFLWSVMVEGQGLLHALLEGPANWYELVGLGRAEWVLSSLEWYIIGGERKNGGREEWREGGREERRKEGGGRKEREEGKKGEKGREGGRTWNEGGRGKERMKEGREQRRNKGGREREEDRGREGEREGAGRKDGRKEGWEEGREEGKTGRQGKEERGLK